MYNSFEELGKMNCSDKLGYVQDVKKELVTFLTNNRLTKERDKQINILNEKIKFYEEQYYLDGCDKNFILENCIRLKQQINRLQDANESMNEDAFYLKEKYKKEYSKYYDCDKVFNTISLAQTSEIASKYKNIDKKRIESERKKLVNQRIFFGGLFLIGAIVIIKILGKKK